MFYETTGLGPRDHLQVVTSIASCGSVEGAMWWHGEFQTLSLQIVPEDQETSHVCGGKIKGCFIALIGEGNSVGKSPCQVEKGWVTKEIRRLENSKAAKPWFPKHDSRCRKHVSRIPCTYHKLPSDVFIFGSP